MSLQPAAVRVADGGPGPVEEEVIRGHDEESDRRGDTHERHDAVVVGGARGVLTQVDRLGGGLAIGRRYHE